MLQPTESVDKRSGARNISLRPSGCAEPTPPRKRRPSTQAPLLMLSHFLEPLPYEEFGQQCDKCSRERLALTRMRQDRTHISANLSCKQSSLCCLHASNSPLHTKWTTEKKSAYTIALRRSGCSEPATQKARTYHASTPSHIFPHY